MLRVPLIDRTLQATGDVLVRAVLKLQLCNRHQQWKDTDFRVDPGTETTMMSAVHARDLDLPMPRLPIPRIDLDTSGDKTASVIRSGLLKARIVGLANVELVIPCFLLGEPDANGQTPLPPNLLGLSSTVNRLRLTFDGTPAPDARYGVLIVETLPQPNPPSA
jgi:hypothetical protein